MQVIRDFFVELDRLWPRPAVPERMVRLSLIGSCALMLQASYERGTKDSDVLETTGLTGEVRQQLNAVAGAGDRPASAAKYLPRHRAQRHPISPAHASLALRNGAQ